MKDQFGRNIEYMRISVTDRCNLRCQYCMPAEGVQSIPHEEIMSFEEIASIVRIAAKLGIHSIRLTGGEPLVRKGLSSLVSEIRSIPGIDAVKITTNGVLLKDQLPSLMEAGLTGINLSLDTFTAGKFQKISRRDEMTHVLEGLDAALAVSDRLSVKINCVPMKGFNDDELIKIALLAKDNRIGVRFIELMPIGLGRAYEGMTQEEIIALLEPILGPLERDERTYDPSVPTEKPATVGSIPLRQDTSTGSAAATQNSAAGTTPATNHHFIDGSGPAVYFHPAGFEGNIGFISAMSHKFCDTCNRIRLTSDGVLKPCLQYTGTTNIKDLLRQGASDRDLENALRSVIFQKPRCHSFLDSEHDPAKETRKMSGIGG